MAFNISEMSANINKRGGLSRSAHFIARFPTLPAMGISDSEVFTEQCKTSSLPGLSVDTTQIYTSGYGTPEKRPTSITISNIDLVFLVDNNSVLETAVNNWMNFITRYQNPANQTTFRFPSEYITQIELIRFRSDGTEQIQYKMIDAFPIAVGAPQLDWENTNALLSLPVSFAYRTWIPNVSGEGPAPSTPAPLLPPPAAEPPLTLLA